MKNVSHLLIGTSIACLLAVYSAHADEDSHGHSDHAGEKRQLDSHEHGVSTVSYTHLTLPTILRV